MKKYHTRPIDFTGCHPVIAEHLKRGEVIECRVWGSDKGCHKNKFVIRYRAGFTCPYETHDWFYKHAEPIPIKTKRIMPPERAIPTLSENGWRFDKHGALIGGPYGIVPQMFAEMGRPLEGNSWKWPDCIIEEVDE